MNFVNFIMLSAAFFFFFAFSFSLESVGGHEVTCG